MTIPIGQPNSPKQPKNAEDNNKGMEWASWSVIGVAIAAVVMLAVMMTNPTASTTSDSAASTDSGQVSSTGDTVTYQIDIQGMLFVPNEVEVPAGSTLVLEITNSDSMQHDLKIGDITTGLIKPGETITQDFGAFNESVQGWCTVAGHKAMGMTFDVNVGEASSDSPHSAHGEHSAASSDSAVPSAAERGVDHEGFAAVDPVLAPASTARVHEHEWTITEEIRQVAPGHKQKVWLFDGQVPGPTLRGKVGDTFRITIHNEGSMDHSIDFHAGEVNPDEHMAQVAPGESLTYEFVARRAGIWMYHCATAPMSLHIANGMAGAVVIDPPLDAVDEEYLFVANELFLGPEEEGAQAHKVSEGDYDLTAFNWYPNQYDIAPLEHKVGDTIRMWVMNVGPDNPLSFHVVGEVFDTVWSEGRYFIRGEKDTGSQALAVLPAQGGFVEMTFDEPGTYTFVNHLMTDAEKGQHGTIIVTQ